MSGYVAPRDFFSPFDPVTDLEVSEPEIVQKFSDIGLHQHGISPVAFAGPFSVFTENVVDWIEHELLSEEVLERHKCGSDPTSFMLRGACPQYAHFSTKAWTHPKTLEVISRVAQVDLVPALDYEISHVNLHLGGKDEGPIVKWHKDSYPFVAILMIRNTSMTGGDLEMRSGTKEVIKTPKMSRGSVMLLQGRWVEHYVPYCVGERITVVTSFRLASPFLRDDTRLTTVRHISNLPRLYYEFFEYREMIAIKRLQWALCEILVWNLKDLMEFVKGLIALYQQTREELLGEVEFDISSIPWESRCFQASQSTKPSSLASSSPKLVPYLKTILKTMVELSEDKIHELQKWDTKNSIDFIVGQENSLEKIRTTVSDMISVEQQCTSFTTAIS